MGGDCQVDFYVLEDARTDAHDVACRLALMAWERGHRVAVLVAGAEAASNLDERMWSEPPGRFLPHAQAGTSGARAAPVTILAEGESCDADLAINLRDSAPADARRFTRVLDFAPADPARRAASRERFRAYAAQGLKPSSHTLKS
ncbi:MAG: DNA polymerase III subunit chi [Xanthomonadales bacterium]|nr:DNA polymerase III subunit chi [Xanthomonadales bacterium]